MKHLNIRVTGRVQGVFFRAFSQQKARELNIRGFVQNEDDGSVYAEAEGTEEDLDAFLAALRKGSPGSRVEDVFSREGAPCNFARFEVRHL